MILTKDEILAEIGFPNGLDAFQVQPHAVDLRIDGDYVLRAGDHVLAKSMDAVRMPADVMAVVYPRSSTNRLRVTLDMTGIVDAGYEGTLTLPLTAWKDTEIKKGTRVASLVFHRLSKAVEVKLSKYHLSSGDYVPDKEDELRLLESGMDEGLRARYLL